MQNCSLSVERKHLLVIYVNEIKYEDSMMIIKTESTGRAASIPIRQILLIILEY